MIASTLATPKPGWRRIILALSLALNLFLGALVSGHLWRTHVRQGPSQPLVARIVSNARAELSARDFAAFDAVIRRDGSRIAADAQQAATARNALESQMEAERYDPVATRRTYDAWHASADRFLDQFRDTLVDALGQVSAQGRHRLVTQTRAEEHAANGR